eukprot:Skav228457  [mRNA]  locus=scaffold1058:222386:222619:+ [translate_table: standard]
MVKRWVGRGLSLEGPLADRVCLGVAGAVTGRDPTGTLVKRDTLLLIGRMMYRAWPSRHTEDGTTASRVVRGFVPGDS